MILVLGVEHLARLERELGSAGAREIGGVLVGHHVEGDRFALLDFSVQRRGGGRAHFRRDPIRAARFVEAAIAHAGGDPTRVNYLGEWHSHPCYSAVPSDVDVAQMREIVDEPSQPALFSVLLVVGLSEFGLRMSATLFRRGVREEPVSVELAEAQGIEIEQTDGVSETVGADVGRESV